MNTVNDVIAAVRGMDSAQLNLVIEAVKLHRNYLTRQTAVTFRVGDRVSFAARGMQVLGVVTKVNTKTVQVVQSNTMTTWKVHAGLLQHVKQMA